MQNSDTSSGAEACSQFISKSDLTISKEIEKLLKQQNLVVYVDKKINTNFKIYTYDSIYLSQMTPLFRNLGFDIIDGVSYTITSNGKMIFVNRFNLEIKDTKQLQKTQDNIIYVLTQALLEKIDMSSQLFALIYLENLTLRQIKLLQSFIEYICQAVTSMSLGLIENTLCKHHSIAKLIVDLFLTKFDPLLKKRTAKLETIQEDILKAIHDIPHVTDDQVLKLIYELLQCMTRSNYFFDHETIAFKIDTKTYQSNLRGLQPNIESFVYGDMICGLHLRMSHISRGGLRHSERYEDYRQEVKSLMITQDGKNSIIVPNGAKGGFIIKEDMKNLSKESFTTYYSIFINNLLDLVDNRVDGKIVRDDRIVAYDEDDSYFVVAADKGTADMSDVANAIAIKRNYWLEDAFASGGSQGYSHKDLGITARGAFKSTERFFIEKKTDLYSDPITVVGIGSMKGDVFGNGILLSKAYKLLASISHKEIFIDPNPVDEVAFAERKRLFLSKNGGWPNYNKSLISEGGGIFLRSSKAITLTPQIQKMIHTTKKALSGEALGKALLSMKVDLFFNGGVGTYVKSSEESDFDVGDKQNEAIRLDATDLNAYAVCEGGNLGFTQKGRIEYAIHGGKINTDGIDNAAGVNTSDHEVNLKIILNSIFHKGYIKEDEKRDILKNLDEKIVNNVLWNNYLQSLCLSKDELLSKNYLYDFLRITSLLEESVISFSRKEFQIPKNGNINSVLTKEGYLVRPILASLLSYSKIFIKNLLLKSTFIDNNFAKTFLYKYFPKSFALVYRSEINQHPVRREIVATSIADFIINNQGILFLHDYISLGNEKFLIKIQAYLINNELFGANDIRYALYRLDHKVDVKKQYKILFSIEKALSFSTIWMVRYLADSVINPDTILAYKNIIANLLSKNYLNNVSQLTESEDVNKFMVLLKYLRFSIAVISIQKGTHRRFEDVAELFFVIIEKLRIMQLFDALDNLEINDINFRKERQQLRKIIELSVIKITNKIQKFRRKDEVALEVFDNFLINGGEHIANAKKEIDDLFESSDLKLHKISIATHSLLFAAL